MRGCAMRGAIRGDHTILIVDPHSVIAQRLPEKIRDCTAGLSENYFRSARVPLFGAGRKMKVQVRFLFSNQTHLDADRSAPRLVLKTKGADDTLHPRAAMRAA